MIPTHGQLRFSTKLRSLRLKSCSWDAAMALLALQRIGSWRQLVVAAPCAGANLTTRKGKVVRVHVCLMPKEIQKPRGGGLFVSCWFLIARDMNKMANKKAKKTKEEPRKLTSVVVQLFGARLGFVCSLVHVLHVFLVLEGPVLFLALLAGTRLFEKPCGGLFANCCFVLFFPVILFARIGVPPQVLGLLKDQWLGQKRWVSFAGTVSPECLGEVPSLPQGDPWSPLALSLVLAAPTKRVQRLYPQVACMVYLDDRTLLAPDVQTLHDVYNEWEILSTVTRLRTNPSKTQCWARNPSVERWFEAHHPGFPVVPAAEILGYIVGLHPEDHPKKAACVTKNETTAARISLLPAGQKIKQLVTTALLTSAAAWGQSLNAWDLDEAAKAHLANWRLAVFGPRPPSSERASPYLKQFFILGHCSDLRFVVITRFIMTLARWYHWRSPSQEVRQAVAEQMQHIVHQVNNGLAEWGWRPTSWGRWACTADHTFSIFSNKNERAKAKHQLRQSWRKTLLLRWLQTDRRDADIGRHINLQDQIDDSFVDQLRKIFKRCTDSHVQAVMMGGMRTAASTRWAGNFEEVTEAGDMVCLDCHQENHPTVDHILWQCPAFSSLRRLPAPTCPFVRRLGWGPSVTIEESVKLLAQMGKIREAEVISRMARVRLQNRIHQIRGGGDTYSWTTKVLYKAKVLAPEVVFLGCCDGAAGAAEDWQLAAAGGGGSLRWRQFDNPEGQSSQECTYV